MLLINPSLIGFLLSTPDVLVYIIYWLKLNLHSCFIPQLFLGRIAREHIVYFQGTHFACLLIFGAANLRGEDMLLAVSDATGDRGTSD